MCTLFVAIPIDRPFKNEDGKFTRGLVHYDTDPQFLLTKSPELVAHLKTTINSHKPLTLTTSDLTIYIGKHGGYIERIGGKAVYFALGKTKLTSSKFMTYVDKTLLPQYWEMIERLNNGYEIEEGCLLPKEQEKSADAGNINAAN